MNILQENALSLLLSLDRLTLLLALLTFLFIAYRVDFPINKLWISMKLTTLSDHFVACQKDIILVANISSCICIFAMVLSGLLLAVFVIYNVKEGWLIRFCFWHTDPLATIVKKMSYDWLELHLWWLFQNCCWVMMKGFWKSICICQSYRQEYCGIFDCQWLVIFFIAPAVCYMRDLCSLVYSVT